jgi:periplasmic protein CpxP/Spy
MKRKLLSLIVGGFVLVAPVITPMAAQANSLGDLPILSGIELTQQQEDQLAQARRQVRSEIEAIVSPEQKNRFKTALERGDGLRAAIAAMNLSSDQKVQVRQVLQASRSTFSSILTAEQRQQLRQNVRSRFMQGNF